MRSAVVLLCLLVCLVLSGPACADSLVVSTGRPDGLMAMASRPGAGGKIEIEAADDVILTQPTSITAGTFTGLLLRSGVTVSDIQNVTIEFYRVFPKDSAFPPSGNVPTRVNSPSDVAFNSRSSGTADLKFIADVLSNTFMANNSVLNGINKKPNQQTLREGPVTGQEVIFSFSISPDLLPADHYFFVPQVQLSDGEFMWLSAPKPIVSGTPLTPDLQAWIRNEELAPDWLRVGTDIVGGSLPQPSTRHFLWTGSRPLPSLLLYCCSGLDCWALPCWGAIASQSTVRGWVKREDACHLRSYWCDTSTAGAASCVRGKKNSAGDARNRRHNVRRIAR